MLFQWFQSYSEKTEGKDLLGSVNWELGFAHYLKYCKWTLLRALYPFLLVFKIRNRNRNLERLNEQDTCSTLFKSWRKLRILWQKYIFWYSYSFLTILDHIFYLTNWRQFFMFFLWLIMNFVVTLSVVVDPRGNICRLLWQCYDEIHCQKQDRHMKNLRQFVFYDNKLTNCQIVHSSLIDASYKL